MKTRARLILLVLCALTLSGGAVNHAAAPNDEETLAAAKRLARTDRAAEAIVLLDKLVAANGELADEAWFQKAWIVYADQRRYREAVALFSELPQRYPQSRFADDALYYAGFIAQTQLQDADLAMDCYRLGYLTYPQGDFHFAIADKMRQMEAEAKAPPAGAAARSATASDAAPLRPAARATVRRPPPETDVADTAPLRPAKTTTVTMQFASAPIRTFVQWVAQVTGRNFVVDDDVSGDITIYSGRPVPFGEVYRIFLSILDVKGFAAVDAGNVTKIVSRQNAVQSELPIVLDDEAYLPTDRVVTRIFRLKTVPARSMQEMIRPFLSGVDQVVTNVETNTLIVTGPAANIARIAEMARLIDGAQDPVFLRSYRISYGRAVTVAEKVNALASSLSTAPGVTPIFFKVVADERTNTVHVVADAKMQAHIQALITELDVDKAAQRLVRIFNLHYAHAEEVVKQLRQLLGLESIENTADFGGVVSTVLIADARTNSLSVSTFAPRIVELVDTYIRQIDRAPAGEARVTNVFRLQNAQATEMCDLLNKIFAASAAGSNDAFVQGLADRVIISPDARTNSVIVTSTAADAVKLAKLVKDLDLRKPQVLVDAVILETTLSEVRSMGVNLTTMDAPMPGSNRILGGSVTGNAAEMVSRGGLVITAVRGSVVGSVLQALLSSSKTNVLQMPQILALDNEYSSINVGNLTPIVTSRSVSSTNVEIDSNSSIYQNIEYRNIGLNLKLKPHVGDHGAILLEMKLEVQNKNAETEVDLPVFTNRAIESKIQITDGDYVILGGLLSTQATNSERKTPWLSQLPLLGILFRNTENKDEKTVLLIFLRPRVVTDPNMHKDVTEEERLQYEAEMRSNLAPTATEMEKWIPQEAQ